MIGYCARCNGRGGSRVDEGFWEGVRGLGEVKEGWELWMRLVYEGTGRGE